MDAMEIDDCVELDADIFADPLLRHAPIDAFQLMAFDGATAKMETNPPRRWLPRIFSKAQETAKKSTMTIDQMLRCQTDPLPTPLLKESMTASDQAIEMFGHTLVVTGHVSASVNDSIAAAHKVLQMALESNELKNELYMQLFKQSRGDLNYETQLGTWKLFNLVASTMPPHSDYRSLLGHYVKDVSRDATEHDDIKQLADSVWQLFKKLVRSGARKTVPTMEEISVMLHSRKGMRTLVYFLDGTMEFLRYDVGTTVLDAVEQLASSIGLMNHHDFSLFESRGHDDNEKELNHTLLYDQSFIADVLSAFSGKATDGKASTLIFKKVMFRASDAYVLESQFLNLSYLQAQFDFLRGHYPVGYQDAARLCALQLFSEFGAKLPKNELLLRKTVENFTSDTLSLTGSKQDWRQCVLDHFSKLQCGSKEDARNAFLSNLRALPYGMAVFFRVNRIEDPLGLLPCWLILGINRTGLHFFKAVPKVYLSSVEFRDIVHFGFCSKTVYFKMKVGGKKHKFLFETTQGEDICMALRSHISDQASNAWASEACSEASEYLPDVVFGDRYDNWMKQMRTAIEASEKKEEELLRSQKADVGQIERDKDLLQELHQAISQSQMSKSAINAQTSEIGAEICRLKQHLRGLHPSVQGNVSSNAVASPSLDVNGLLTREASSKLHRDQCVTENQLLQTRLEKLEEKKNQEIKELKESIERTRAEGRQLCATKEGHAASLVEKVGNMTAMLNADAKDIERIKREKKELAELKELQSVVEERNREHAAKIEEQKNLIDQSEEMCKKVQLDKKKTHNELQNLRGKIRVYARVRPILESESNKGQRMALKIEDDLSISHQWKREDCRKEYTFDGVLPPDATQDDVFGCVDGLIQSALDGYNVCIFAYGQTGSGKTYTIHGNAENPGLVPKGVEQLFQLLNANADKSSFVVTCYMLELYRDSLMDLLSVNKAKLSTRRRCSELPTMQSPRQRLSMQPRISECRHSTDNRRASEAFTDSSRLQFRRDSNLSQMIGVQDVTMIQVHSAEELMAIFEKGQKDRHVASTQMNIESSRSHLITNICIEATDLQTLTRTRGKLTFVDLAGSERLKKSKSTGDQEKEARAINKSLSALGDVISALARGDSHIPYRNHKLTMLMSDSIGGNAKTLMFVNVSPTDANLDETQNSLQYATRVKTIKNKATKETNKKAAELKKQIAFWKSLSAEDARTTVRSLLEEYI